MKKFTIVLLSLLTILLSSCSRSSVDADEEGVFVKKPYFFGSGGVSKEPLSNGSEWKVSSTDFVKFKMSPVQYQEKFDDIMSDDNTPVDLTANILLQIQTGKTPILLEEFGEKWYDNNIRVQFCKYTRDEISRFPMFQLTSNREVYDKIEKVIIEKVTAIINEKKMPITVIAVVVDRAKPNKGVLEEIDRTAIQIQNERTQTQRITTEEKRKLAEIKRAEADKAYQSSMALSTDQYIKLRSLEIEKEKVEMIKNKANVKINMLMGGGAQPIYNVND